MKNTWVSGFGVDFMRETVLSTCTADGNGHSKNGGTTSDRDSALGSSGFGIGSGAYEVESCQIMDCIAINNGNHGISCETEVPATTGSNPSLAAFTTATKRGVRIKGDAVDMRWDDIEFA